MTESINVANIETKESINSLQKNQERWKVINGGETTPKTLEALGGEEGVNLVKSGWEKQKTGAGFDKSGEELEALGGAANVDKLEKLWNYSEEMRAISETEGKIIDPEKPEIDKRNAVVYEVIQGKNWEDLNDEQKELLGGEGYVETIRSGWNKQSENEGTGALKSAEELMALSGNRGSAGLEKLMEDMKSMDEYRGKLQENGEELNKLFDKRKEVEEKYNLSDEEKQILFPEEGEEEVGEVLEEVVTEQPITEQPINEEKDPVDDFSRYFDLVRKINPTDEEKAELERLKKMVSENMDQYRAWREAERNKQNKLPTLGEEGDKVANEDEGENAVNNNEDKGDEGEGLPTLSEEDNEEGGETNNEVTEVTEEEEGNQGEEATETGEVAPEPVSQENPEENEVNPNPVVEEIKPESEEVIGTENGGEKEESPRKKRFWESIKKFFAGSYNEPTKVVAYKAADTFFGRIKQIFAGEDLPRFEDYKSYSSLEELQEAKRSGELTFTSVDGDVNKAERELDKVEKRMKALQEKADKLKERARVNTKGVEEIVNNL